MDKPADFIFGSTSAIGSAFEAAIKQQASISLLKQPEPSGWKCYLFGNTPKTNTGIMYTPAKGNVPNFFIRWMMKVCLGCTWVKEKKNGD